MPARKSGVDIHYITLSFKTRAIKAMELLIMSKAVYFVQMNQSYHFSMILERKLVHHQLQFASLLVTVSSC
jgi:hypothetical protein